MKVAIACDHRGLEWKQQVSGWLKAHGHTPVDCGCFNEESCDYPEFMFAAGEKVRDGQCERAVGICHSGIGSTIAANKVAGVRAALVLNQEMADLSRRHNDANMLILGSGFFPLKDLPVILETWFASSFEGGRHQRRVNQIKEYECRKQPQ